MVNTTNEKDIQLKVLDKELALTDVLFGITPEAGTTAPVSRRVKTETKCYLEQPGEDREVDAIKWWHLHSHRFQNLVYMAQDYLAIPASSVLSERLFSQAGDLITKK